MDKIYERDTNSKPFDTFLKNNYKESLVGAEIGVWFGTHARGLLENMDNIKMLYLIDPYVPYHDGRLSRDRESVRYVYGRFRNDILESNLKDRIKFIKKYSSVAINDVPSGMDFVYIDGNHSHDYVKRDIELYYRKVRVGGLFGGDDYNYSRLPEVTIVVNEFVEKHNLRFYSESYKFVTGKTPVGWGMNNDWWVIKS